MAPDGFGNSFALKLFTFLTMDTQPTPDTAQLLERERTAKEICAELNDYVELTPVLHTVLKRIKSITGCEAAAIRLHSGGDYPYYTSNGLSETFIQSEDSICHQPTTIGAQRIKKCMCAAIIHGTADPAQPGATPGGSFWSNDTTAFLAQFPEKERPSAPIYYCHASGYESVALIPIKARAQTVGLLQLNDHRKGMFCQDLVEYLEMLGMQIGLAVRNAALYTKLKQALEETKILHGLLPICAGCKRIRDDAGYWHQIESFMEKHSEMQFSHGLCPACILERYPEMNMVSDTDLDFVVDLPHTQRS